MPWSSEWSLFFRLSYQNLEHFSFLSHACHMTCLPHSPSTCCYNTCSYWLIFIKIVMNFVPSKNRTATRFHHKICAWRKAICPLSYFPYLRLSVWCDVVRSSTL
jgi:hypothetical protein